MISSRPECAHGGTRQDQIWLHVALRQSLTHLRCVASAVIVQWPVFVGQCGVVPTGLGVANEKERFHGTSRTGGRCCRRWSALVEAAASNRRDQARRIGSCSEYRAFSKMSGKRQRPDVAQTVAISFFGLHATSRQSKCCFRNKAMDRTWVGGLDLLRFLVSSNDPDLSVIFQTPEPSLGCGTIRLPRRS